MLTKKHFEELASIIRNSWPPLKGSGEYQFFDDPGSTIEKIQSDLEDFCMKHNPRFDLQRFRDACERKRDGS